MSIPVRKAEIIPSRIKLCRLIVSENQLFENATWATPNRVSRVLLPPGAESNCVFGGVRHGSLIWSTDPLAIKYDMTEADAFFGDYPDALKDSEIRYPETITFVTTRAATSL